MNSPLVSSVDTTSGAVLPTHSSPFRSTSSLFDAPSTHTRLIKLNSDSLKLDIPYAELTNITWMYVRYRFILWLIALFILVTFPLLHLIVIASFKSFGLVCYNLFIAAIVAIVVTMYKRMYFCHETIEISSTTYYLIVKSIAYSSLINRLLSFSNYDLEPNSISEVIVKEKSGICDESFHARVAPSRQATGYDLHRIKLGPLEFGRGLSFNELTWLVSEINSVLK